MKRSYQQKLILSFLAIFTLFTIGIIVFEQYRGKRYKTEALTEKLDAYADLIHNYLNQKSDHTEVDWANLLAMLPSNLRLTWVDSQGNVAYDNLFAEPSQLENHAQRPEIVTAKELGKGSEIRISASNSHPYLYYAKYYGNGFIRVALPYDIEVQSFLKPDNGFLYFIFGLFLIGLLLIRYVGGSFGRSIRQLRDFSRAIAENKSEVVIPNFPKDELGEIGAQLVEDYNLLKNSETKLSLEKEKLLQHVQSSAEGICFFQPDASVAFYNGLFLQYLNIMHEGSEDEKEILSIQSLQPANEFLASGSEENYFETIVARNGREFLLRLNRFEDGGFEIVLNDITKQEKTKQLKKEMTGNIAHELRTPVTSIRGFLETVLESSLSPEQQRDFLEKAYHQTLTLSDLIRDIGLLTKIEENPTSFDFHPVNLKKLVDTLQAELQAELQEGQVTFRSLLPDDLTIRGNESLVRSIFRNLTDNVIKHAGSPVSVTVKELNKKDGLVYLSFADNGKGVKDVAQLTRIFERFYRSDEGRTRDAGGSGLGLSIVKNALKIQGGTISVKKGSGGGLEFILSFSL